MAINILKNSINILEDTVLKQGGMVILPLKKWQQIEMALEDMVMYNSESLVEDIAERRQDKNTISLDSVLEKYNI